MTWPSLISYWSIIVHALAQHILLMPLHLRHPRFADGHAFALAVEIPHGAEGERAGFFLEGEAGGKVARKFRGPDGGRFEEREEQGAEQIARADDPRGDAIDARVEVVEANVDAAARLERTLAPPASVGDDLTGDGLEIVGERDDMVAVPAYAAADM